VSLSGWVFHELVGNCPSQKGQENFRPFQCGPVSPSLPCAPRPLRNRIEMVASWEIFEQVWVHRTKRAGRSPQLSRAVVCPRWHSPLRDPRLPFFLVSDEIQPGSRGTCDFGYGGTPAIVPRKPCLTPYLPRPVSLGFHYRSLSFPLALLGGIPSCGEYVFPGVRAHVTNPSPDLRYVSSDAYQLPIILPSFFFFFFVCSRNFVRIPLRKYLQWSLVRVSICSLIPPDSPVFARNAPGLLSS